MEKADIDFDMQPELTKEYVKDEDNENEDNSIINEIELEI